MSIPIQEVSFSSQVHRVRDIWRIVTMNRKVAFGLGIITFFVLVAIFGPIILTSDPNAFSIDILSPPRSHTGWVQRKQDRMSFCRLWWVREFRLSWALPPE